MERIMPFKLPPRTRPAPPDNPPGESCAKCRFFAPMGSPSADLSQPQGGLCRRYPPTAQVLGMQQNPVAGQPPIPTVGRAMPQVFAPEWCGKFSKAAE